eukprot:IDg14884t1
MISMDLSSFNLQSRAADDVTQVVLSPSIEKDDPTSSMNEKSKERMVVINTTITAPSMYKHDTTTKCEPLGMPLQVYLILRARLFSLVVGYWILRPHEPHHHIASTRHATRRAPCAQQNAHRGKLHEVRAGVGAVLSVRASRNTIIEAAPWQPIMPVVLCDTQKAEATK